MKKLILLFSLLLSLSYSQNSHAIYTELGVNYGERLTVFDENNTVKSKSTTASLSLYIWETVGIELSHTNSIMERNEKYTVENITSSNTITQYQTISGADLIFSFASRKSFIQPYVKGGMAYIQKRQVNADEYGEAEIKSEPGTAPSYGAGIKFMLSEAFAIKASYDVWQTPNSDSKITDNATRLGLQWIF